MRVARGRVVNGAVIADASLPEGARVAIFVEDGESEFVLSPDDEKAIEDAVNALDAGQGLPISDLKQKLSQVG